MGKLNYRHVLFEASHEPKSCPCPAAGLGEATTKGSCLLVGDAVFPTHIWSLVCFWQQEFHTFPYMSCMGCRPTYLASSCHALHGGSAQWLSFPKPPWPEPILHTIVPTKVDLRWAGADTRQLAEH